MNKKNRTGLNIGSSSVLLIFILLALVTFAVLSIVNANADYRLSKTYEDRTTAYYEAANAAEEKLAQIDTRLIECREAATNENAYIEQCQQQLSADSELTLRTDDKGLLLLSFAASIDDSQDLNVELVISFPEKAGDTCYQISQWKVVNTKEWEGDDSLNLITFD